MSFLSRGTIPAIPLRLCAAQASQGLGLLSIMMARSFHQISADTRFRVTANPSNYLAVWTDPRNYGTTQYDIFARRISPSGVPISPIWC